MFACGQALALVSGPFGCLLHRQRSGNCAFQEADTKKGPFGSLGRAPSYPVGGYPARARISTTTRMSDIIMSFRSFDVAGPSEPNFTEMLFGRCHPARHLLPAAETIRTGISTRL